MIELLTLSNYDEFYQFTQHELSLVDFGTPWSSPCRNQYKVFINFIRRYDGIMIIGRVDVEKHPGIARKCNIQTVPTLIVCRKSKEIKRMVGLQSVENISAVIKDLSKC